MQARASRRNSEIKAWNCSRAQREGSLQEKKKRKIYNTKQYGCYMEQNALHSDAAQSAAQ